VGNRKPTTECTEFEQEARGRTHGKVGTSGMRMILPYRLVASITPLFVIADFGTTQKCPASFHRDAPIFLELQSKEGLKSDDDFKLVVPYAVLTRRAAYESWKDSFLADCFSYSRT